jgi:hypothetical protein
VVEEPLGLIEERSVQLDVVDVVVGDLSDAVVVEGEDRGARECYEDRGVGGDDDWEPSSTRSCILRRNVSWPCGESAASGSSSR